MRTKPETNRRRPYRAAHICLAVLLLISLALPVAAASAQVPTAPTPPRATVARTTTPRPSATARASVVASPTTVQGLPTITPTATSTRTGKPASGLVLVPLAVRYVGATNDVAPEKGAVTGRVREASGRGLWGQVVRVSRQGFSQTAQTGDDGVFLVGNLEPGSYSVVVENNICTPAEGVAVNAGQTAQVDFAQIRPAAGGTVTATPARTPTPSATPTATRTPLPPTPTATASPTPTPRSPASPFDITRWWTWLGFDIDLSSLASHLYLGIMGGFLLFAIGIVIAIVRR